MSSQAVYPPVRDPAGTSPLGAQVQRKHPRHAVPPSPFRFPAYSAEGDIAQRQAELFYLQKQIQSQTPMVIVLEDGELIEGQIEWYDRYFAQSAGPEPDADLQIRHQVHVQAGRGWAVVSVGISGL